MVDQFAPPAGFEQRASGLVIPRTSEPAAVEREQWTEQEAKILARAEKVLRRHSLIVILGCDDKRCADAPEVVRRERPGGFAYTCRHKERVILFSR